MERRRGSEPGAASISIAPVGLGVTFEASVKDLPERWRKSTACGWKVFCLKWTSSISANVAVLSKRVYSCTYISVHCVV